MKNYTPHKGTPTLSMTMLMFIVLSVFLLWASFSTIDQTVRAQGQIIPSARTQIIQAADGGVLAEILVQEGQQVSAGQSLAKLEKTRGNASFEESRTKIAAIKAGLTRANAEATGKPLIFDESIQAYPEFINAQKSLYEQRKQGLNEELSTLKFNLNMAQEELRMNENLFSTGDISRLEVMRAKRQVSEINGKISAARNKYLQEARQEVSKLEEELSLTGYKMEERQSVLEHTELTAPVAGVVKYLKINTIGGVLRAGDELMQISPTESEMVIEVKINPVDIGQLKIGLPVTIKLDAFDYSTFGTMRGKLSYISSDTLTEQSTNGQSSSFYRAQVTIDAANTQENPKLADKKLRPGMTATVDVTTDSRTVLEYLAKPILKAFSGAMNER